MAELNNDVHQLPDNDNFNEDSDIQRILANDPTLSEFCICSHHYLPTSVSEWRKLGHHIGNNTRIRDLDILNKLAKKNAEAFFEGFVSNRSISRLTFLGCKFHRGKVLQQLIPFVQNNKKLRHLSLLHSRLGPIEIHYLRSALSTSKTLKRISLSSLRIPQTLNDKLVLAVFECPQLEDLFLSFNQIGLSGCLAIAEHLQSSQTTIKCLRLDDNNIGDDCMVALSNALASNSNLNKLNLDYNSSITSVGWGALSSALTSSRCGLRELSVEECGIDDDGIVELARGVANSKNLVKLELGYNDSITVNGWESFSDVLQSSRTKLKDISLVYDAMRDGVAVALSKVLTHTNLKHLDLSGNAIGDDGVFALSDALDGNSRLNKLVLDRNDTVSTMGWESLSIALQNPLNSLKKLSLNGCSIDEEGIAILSYGLAQNTTLETLDLHGNSSISLRGWEEFATSVLQSQTCKLKKLFLGSTDIDDSAMCALSASLATNQSLSVMTLEHNPITKHGWDRVSDILCRKKNIRETLDSNHTLTQLMQFDFVADGMLLDLLRMNRKKEKRSVAVLKVVMIHLSGSNYCMDPFYEMKLPLLIHVIGRISKSLDGDRRSEIDRLSALYRLLMGIPSLLLFASGRNDEQMNK